MRVAGSAGGSGGGAIRQSAARKSSATVASADTKIKCVRRSLTTVSVPRMVGGKLSHQPPHILLILR